MRSLFFFFALMLAGAGAQGQVIRERRTLAAGDRARNYVLEFSDRVKPTLLLLAFHGGGDSAERFLVQTEKIRRVALERGFVLVYPQGWQNAWDDGRPAKATGAGDLEFVRSLVAEVTREYHLRPGRAFAFGFSNGGGLVYRIGCELSDLVSGGAVVKMLMSEQLIASCHPGKPFSLLILVDRDDPVVPIRGGMIVNQGRELGRVVSLERTGQFWRKANRGLAPVKIHTLAGSAHNWPSPEISSTRSQRPDESQVLEIPNFFLSSTKR